MSHWSRVEGEIRPITMATVWNDKTAPKPKRKSSGIAKERSAKFIAMMNARWADPEFRQRQRKASSDANKARMADPEKKKIAIANFKIEPWRKAAICRAANAKRYSDPEERRKISELAKRLYAEGKFGGHYKVSPEGEARRNVARVIMHNKRRGFVIPKHLRREYDNLLKKRFKAREAGVMLGIIKVAHKQSIFTLEEYKVLKGELGKIMHAVETVTGVSTMALLSNSRTTKTVRARQVFYYVSKTYCRHSYPAIGRAVGRDHSTVMSGCKKVKAHTESYSPTIRKVLDLLIRETGKEAA